MTKEEFIKLLDEIRFLEFNDVNVREFPVLVMGIKQKASENFPELTKLNHFVNLLLRKEYKEYLSVLNKYIANEITLEDIKPVFTTLRVVIPSDLSKHLR